MHEVSYKCMSLRSIIYHIQSICKLSSTVDVLIIIYEDNATYIVQSREGYIKDKRKKYILLKYSILTSFNNATRLILNKYAPLKFLLISSLNHYPGQLLIS